MGMQRNSVDQTGRIIDVSPANNEVIKSTPKFGLKFLTKTDNKTSQASFPAPLYLSSKGYGLLLFETGPSVFNLGSSNSRTGNIKSKSGRLDLFVFYGPSPLETIEEMTSQTGRIKVPPPLGIHPLVSYIRSGKKNEGCRLGIQNK